MSRVYPEQSGIKWTERDHKQERLVRKDLEKDNCCIALKDNQKGNGDNLTEKTDERTRRSRHIGNTQEPGVPRQEKSKVLISSLSSLCSSVIFSRLDFRVYSETRSRHRHLCFYPYLHSYTVSFCRPSWLLICAPTLCSLTNFIAIVCLETDQPEEESVLFPCSYFI